MSDGVDDLADDIDIIEINNIVDSNQDIKPTNTNNENKIPTINSLNLNMKKIAY